ncbi:hypothetical protein FGRMN_447 [Fusarium graminum]|nr:hypothetical protein FGRMN_447 [Fusarium graminum]
MDEEGTTIPKFVVDLSQPPETRHAHIIPHLREPMIACDLPSLFDEVTEIVAGPFLGKLLVTITRFALRRVHSTEETAELVEMSKALGIPMHILVAFNVLLDLLLGCTSGGARVLDSDTVGPTTRILRFRTLDWAMHRLRQIIVELDYVRVTGGPVIATTVTYFGYVGVLTGVRKGLSMSLNFRPYHTRDTVAQRLSFRWHQAMVFLGFRQSISSSLRNILLDPSPASSDPPRNSQDIDPLDLGRKGVSDKYVKQILERLSTSDSSSAYLIFCQPDTVYIIEKDHRSATVRQSETFLTACNHDTKDEEDPSQLQQVAGALAEGGDATGMGDIVGISVSKKNHLEKKWRLRVGICRKRYNLNMDVVTLSDVRYLLEDDQICTPETHFAVIMDPKEGKVVWRRQFEFESELCSDCSWSTTDED